MDERWAPRSLRHLAAATQRDARRGWSGSLFCGQRLANGFLPCTRAVTEVERHAGDQQRIACSDPSESRLCSLNATFCCSKRAVTLGRNLDEGQILNLDEGQILNEPEREGDTLVGWKLS
jgi:hypothetical protein